jgi:hypothetical protein
MRETKEIVTKENSVVAEFNSIRELSAVFYEAGIFEDVKSEAQAIVKIVAGREMGLSPMESMNGLYIVKGRVEPMTSVVSSLIKKDPEYDYRVVTLTDEECVLMFTKNDKDLGESSFSFADAAKAGLVNKDVWKNFPRNMMFSRALANGKRWYCPHVCSGGVAEEVMELGSVQEPKTDVIEITDTGAVVKNGE